MFFDVTRVGGLMTLRVAVSAVAYLAEAPDGCALRLIGGETIRVNEDPAEIERRMVETQLPAQAEFVGGAPIEPLSLQSGRIHHNSKGRRSR
ncbi:MAG: hypothetical protein ABT10_02950 [Novosphingobium sp. SCN 63-17]|mgnify:CR=1 FL=1|nr:MAG: hypothetical protein ABT10_02950 [Novosphingobium sp. SCN 63-17]OJX92897.1 MAG: hypothetical protein BGP00_23550 [Novosphingobium sp. 63-713]